MLGPSSIETNVRLASMRQIHAAIEHHVRQDWECAITLAAAAEGILPDTNEPHFRQKAQDLAKSLPETLEGSKEPNDIQNWLKHGKYKGKKCETATIGQIEAPVAIWRAITKFWAIYNDASPQMRSWKRSVQNEFEAEKNATKIGVGS